MRHQSNGIKRFTGVLVGALVAGNREGFQAWVKAAMRSSAGRCAIRAEGQLALIVKGTVEQGGQHVCRELDGYLV